MYNHTAPLGHRDRSQNREKANQSLTKSTMASRVPWECLGISCAIKHCVGLQMLWSPVLRSQINLHEALGTTTGRERTGKDGAGPQDTGRHAWLWHQLSEWPSPVSWPLWMSSLNERTDLDALKPSDSNLQFYSDTFNHTNFSSQQSIFERIYWNPSFL